MALIFFILCSSLANGDETDSPVKDDNKDREICVSCDNTDADQSTVVPEITIEIIIDPVTGKIKYVVKGLVVE
tara:strand:+ start:436 stop:654 length:219 start_codon:yes stop_codon:yes gene_type:complete